MRQWASFVVRFALLTVVASSDLVGCAETTQGQLANSPRVYDRVDHISEHVR